MLKMPWIVPVPLIPVRCAVPVPGRKAACMFKCPVIGLKVPAKPIPTVPALPSIVPVNVPLPAMNPDPVDVITATSVPDNVPEISPIVLMVSL